MCMCMCVQALVPAHAIEWINVDVKDGDLVLSIIDFEDQTQVIRLAWKLLLSAELSHWLPFIFDSSGSENVRLMAWTLGLMGVVLQLS